MAERYARDEAPLVIHPTEAKIHKCFDDIIYHLNKRREKMITQFREKSEEKRAATTARENTLQQLINSKDDLLGRMKENLIRSMREKMVDGIDNKMKQLQVVEKETEFVFECDTRQLEQTISVIGQLIEKEIISIPNYSAFSKPSVSVGMSGDYEGELDFPNGVAFDEKSKLIYVAAEGFAFEPGNISVFSITGEYIDRYYKRIIKPFGIVISKDNHAFVTSKISCRVYKYELPGFKLVTKVGGKGDGVREFNSPRYLTLSSNSVLI